MLFVAARAVFVVGALVCVCMCCLSSFKRFRGLVLLRCYCVRALVVDFLLSLQCWGCVRFSFYVLRACCCIGVVLVLFVSGRGCRLLL